MDNKYCVENFMPSNFKPKPKPEEPSNISKQYVYKEQSKNDYFTNTSKLL